MTTDKRRRGAQRQRAIDLEHLLRTLPERLQGARAEPFNEPTNDGLAEVGNLIGARSRGLFVVERGASRKRLAQVGGSLTVQSTIGTGTHARVVVPNSLRTQPRGGA